MKVLNVFVLVFLLTTALEFVQARGRIFNGMDAREGQFKGLARLKVIAYNGDEGNCGGSVVDHYTIMTAAHCLIGVKEVIIYMGSNKRNEDYLVLHANADAFIIHEDYEGYDSTNDIGLIKTTYIPFDRKVQPVKLPYVEEGEDLFAGRSVSIGGWGRTDPNSNDLPLTLQFTHMQVLSNEDAKKEHSYKTSSRIQPTNICANGVDSRTCVGDSGSPMFLDESDIQIGLSSFGDSKDCSINLSRIYTRISSYVQWIKNHL